MAVVGGLDSHVGQLVRLQVEFVHICTIHVIFFCYCILLYVFVLSTFRSHIRAVSEQLLLLAILVTVAPGGNRVPLFKQHFSLQLMLRILTLFLHISVWRSVHQLK